MMTSYKTMRWCEDPIACGWHYEIVAHDCIELDSLCFSCCHLTFLKSSPLNPIWLFFLRKCPSNCISGAKVILRQYLRSRIRLLVVKTFCRSHCATNHNWHSNKWEKEVTKSWQQFWKNDEFSRKGRVNSLATEILYCCKQGYRLRFLCRGYHD